MANIKQACKNGDLVYHTFMITNTGLEECNNTSGTITVPAGVQLNYRSTVGNATPIVSTGVFNPTSYIWYAGNLAGGARETIKLEFQIIDETLFGADDFIVEFEITSSCVEPTADNVDWLCIEKYCPVAAGEPCDNLNITLK